MNYHGPVKGYPENDHLDQSAAYVGDQRDHATLGGQEQPAPSIEILMVAEKPSIARAIADCLTGEKYLTRRGE